MNAAAWTWAFGILASTRVRSAVSATFEPVDESSAMVDASLLRRIAAGESTALGEFYDLHSGALFALAFRILNDSKEAEDVLQDVFLQIWNKAGAYDPAQGHAFTWALTLTRNKAIDRLRSTRRRSRLLEEAAAQDACETTGFPPPAAPAAQDEAEMTRAALARLPKEQRRPIEMAFFGGLTQSEIACALNEPLGTIKARIRRGMLKLREELEPSLRIKLKSPPFVAAP